MNMQTLKQTRSQFNPEPLPSDFALEGAREFLIGTDFLRQAASHNPDPLLQLFLSGFADSLEQFIETEVRQIIDDLWAQENGQ